MPQQHATQPNNLHLEKKQNIGTVGTWIAGSNHGPRYSVVTRNFLYLEHLL
jgi:hypothetical protein